MTFAEGAAAGKPVDTKQLRPLVTVPSDVEAALRESPGDRIVGNFRHAGRHWVARIPADAVEEVFVQRVDHVKLPQSKWLLKVGVDTSNFAPIAHQQFRFKLKPGAHITLFEEVGGQYKPAHQITDVIFTADSAGERQSEAFNPVKALRGEYLMVPQMMSVQEGWFLTVGSLRRPVVQYRLAADPAQTQALFQKSIQRSIDAGYSEPFRLYTHNCTTVTHDLLSEVGVTPSRWDPRSSLLSSFSQFPAYNLGARGFWNEHSRQVPTFNQEFQHLGDEPQMRERVRRAVRAAIQERRAELANPGPSQMKQLCHGLFISLMPGKAYR